MEELSISEKEIELSGGGKSEEIIRIVMNGRKYGNGVKKKVEIIK